MYIYVFVAFFWPLYIYIYIYILGRRPWILRKLKDAPPPQVLDQRNVKYRVVSKGIDRAPYISAPRATISNICIITRGTSSASRFIYI